MKVLDSASKGVSVGARVAVRDLGLPVTGRDGVLIVFWKDR
jgi:hypothetical protein